MKLVTYNTNDNTIVLKFSGAYDITHLHSLVSLPDKLPNGKIIVFDISNCKNIGSDFLNIIISAYKTNEVIVYVGENHHANDLLISMGLTSVINIINDKTIFYERLYK